MPQVKKTVGQIALIGIGGILALTYGGVVLLFDDPVVISIGFPALMAITVVSAAVWLSWEGVSALRFYWIGIWCATVTILAIALGTVNVFTEWLVRGTIQSAMIMIANSATIGAVLGVLVGFYDADRQQQHQSLEEQQTQIEYLNERLTVLNRVLRHDIRNDVNLVEGYADMAAADQIDHEEAYEMIKRKAQEIADVSHQARQVEDLIRDRTGHERVDLAAMVEEEVAMIRKSHPDELNVSLSIPEEALILGTGLLQSMIHNILQNAIEHVDRSPIEITVSMTEAGDGYLLEIGDNGEGLPKHEQQLFDQGSETALSHSSGLGLWIVNWVVRECNGHIDVDGTNGTVFQIWLPKPGFENANDEREAAAISDALFDHKSQL